VSSINFLEEFASLRSLSCSAWALCTDNLIPDEIFLVQLEILPAGSLAPDQILPLAS